jgi:nucleotide-binding universal stress UspA family protein
MKLMEVSSHTGISLKNVLFAADFSETSQVALPYAVAICQRYNCHLHAVHVISPASYIVASEPVGSITIKSMHEAACADAQKRMEALASHLTTVPHHTYVREGGVWEVISDMARIREIDLLVVGTHGRTGLEKLVLGSKAEEILRQAPCPVLTVGSKVSGEAKFPTLAGESRDLTPLEISVRHIVYAIDFTPESLAAAPFAASLAQEFQARLTLLHVIEEYSGMHRPPGPIEFALQRLEKLMPEEASLCCSPDPIVQFGSPAECILQRASESKADLIVLGVRSAARHLAAATHLPWATAHKVIAHAPCPVLTIPFTTVLHREKERGGFFEFGEVIP